MTDPCQAVCWMTEYARNATCDLDANHEGNHVDKHEGWEW